MDVIYGYIWAARLDQDNIPTIMIMMVYMMKIRQRTWMVMEKLA